MMSEKSSLKRLLLYAPVPLFQGAHGFLLEDQACNGLRLWSENFDEISVMMPVANGLPPDNWVPIEQVGYSLDRINLVPLPMAYRPDQFAKHFFRTREIILNEIDKANYLSFSIGGLFGDWGSLSCYLASSKDRKYAVWTDRVESEVIRRTMHSGTWRHRLRARMYHRPMAWLEKFLIKRSSLGLFHGRETFDTYAPFCSNPQIVHDIHIKKSEHISAGALQDKLEQATQKRPLEIIYVGRAEPMKGGLDWISVLVNLAHSGVSFNATWLGSGPDLSKMQEIISNSGLSDYVKLPGFVADRSNILAALRSSDIFLFCHKTPESPRCLIEALVSGTPIIGYCGSFAQDLIAENGGGQLVNLNDTSALTNAITQIDLDRLTLRNLIAKAARDGVSFDDETVFSHRSQLIREFL